MFIKLTRWKSGQVHGEPVYLNPLTITSINADISYTRVNTVDNIWNVNETPEEILEEISGKLSIYEKVTIFGKAAE